MTTSSPDKAAIDRERVQALWREIEGLMLQRPISSEARFWQMAALLDTLVDASAQDQSHELTRLLDRVGDVVIGFREATVPIQDLLDPDPGEGSRGGLLSAMATLGSKWLK